VLFFCLLVDGFCGSSLLFPRYGHLACTGHVATCGQRTHNDANRMVRCHCYTTTRTAIHANWWPPLKFEKYWSANGLTEVGKAASVS
jgi:hypothetical protein